MISAARRLYTFSNQYPLRILRPDARPVSKQRSLPTGGDTSAKQRIFGPILPQDRTTNDRKTIAWPTNIQSRTLDGQFGPANQMPDWSDCWFLASLGAMANDEQGRKILAESIKQVTVAGIRGYAITFKGAPNHPVFISEQELTHCVDENGGDTDTRLIELAADRFFSVAGRFRSLFIAAHLSRGMDQNQAEQCFDTICQNNGVQDPENHNPMRSGSSIAEAFFMFTGIFPDLLWANGVTVLQISDIIAYLKRYAPNSRDRLSIALGGIETPLGSTKDAQRLVEGWDLIRTEITSNGTADVKQQAFLNALDRWLETPDDTTWQALRSAAKNLKLQHISPVAFVALLNHDRIALRPSHRARLRSGVQEVLGGGLGYIGVPGMHSETIEGINAAQKTFAYSDPNFPTVVHTGALTHLIKAIANGHVMLVATKPTTGQDAAESSHAGEKRGRHLLALHHRAVNDGTIDPTESGPLANLLAMDDGAFRQIYDSDHNGVIEGSELKAVQLRVDRWATYLMLTQIWS